LEEGRIEWLEVVGGA